MKTIIKIDCTKSIKEDIVAIFLSNDKKDVEELLKRTLMIPVNVLRLNCSILKVKIDGIVYSLYKTRPNRVSMKCSS